MPKHPGRHSLAVKAEALPIAVVEGVKAAAFVTNVSERTISRWVAAADPAEVASLVEEKRARASGIVLERMEKAVNKVMDTLEQATDDKQAKMAQALATTLGIMDDHFGGRARVEAEAGRYGRQSGGADPRMRDLGRRILERLGGEAETLDTRTHEGQG